MPLVAKLFNEPAADEPAAADNDNFHDKCPMSATCPRRSRQLNQTELGRGRAIGIDPLDDLGPALAVLIVLQVAVDRLDRRPAVLDVQTEHGIKKAAA